MKSSDGRRDIKLTPSLRSMLERIERNSGKLLMLTITASGGREYTKLNKLRSAGYVVKCDHPTVKDGGWPAEALAIAEAGRASLSQRPRIKLEKRHDQSSDA